MQAGHTLYSTWCMHTGHALYSTSACILGMHSTTELHDEPSSVTSKTLILCLVLVFELCCARCVPYIRIASFINRHILVTIQPSKNSRTANFSLICWNDAACTLSWNKIKNMNYCLVKRRTIFYTNVWQFKNICAGNSDLIIIYLRLSPLEIVGSSLLLLFFETSSLYILWLFWNSANFGIGCGFAFLAGLEMCSPSRPLIYGWSNCLCLPKAGIIGVHHYIWLWESIKGLKQKEFLEMERWLSGWEYFMFF